MVSLKDVAAACGMSVTQVSRALNDRHDVSEKTKEKVRKVAADLGYVKNLNAQILVNRGSNQIAIIISGVDKDKNAEPSIVYNVMKGVNRFASEKGYEAVVYLNENPRSSLLDFCRQRGLGGVILFGVNYDEDSFIELMASDFPCVVIDIPVEGARKGCVLVNNFYYSMLATQRLIQLGKRNVVMLSGHGRSMVEVERRSGYEMALRKHGLTVDPRWVVPAGFDLEQAHEKTLALMREYPKVDGLFCASDFMALGALRALKEMSRRVPEDVAVFGFDGILMGEFSTPPLSTIRQDNIRKGYCAAKLLCEILSDTQQESTVMVACEMVIRESAG